MRDQSTPAHAGQQLEGWTRCFDKLRRDLPPFAPQPCFAAALPLPRFHPSAETFNALLLAKSLTKRLWTDSRLETRQLAGIGPQIAQRLADAGVSKLRQLAEVEPRRLESLAQRRYPFGELVL